MKSIIVFIIILFNILCISGQNIFQEGAIRELNSQRKPISGVFIKFENSGSTNSDDYGKFQIVFQNKKAGDLIFLEDLKKSGYELVNRKDFEIIRISNTNMLGIDIILAKSGVINAAKKEYYGVSDRSLIASFEKEKQILKNQLKIAKINEQEYVAQLKNKQEQYDIQHKSLDALSEKFARVNFDDVNPIYKEALGLFKIGNISEAILKLESTNPIQRTADIISEEQRLIVAQGDLDNQKTILAAEKKRQIYTVRLLADMYSINFDIKNAELQFDQLLKLDSTNLEILDQVSFFYRKQHRYNKSEKIINKIISNKDAEPWQIANAHGDLGNLYSLTGSLTDALKEFELSSQVYKKLHADVPNSKLFKINLAATYDYLGATHIRLGNIEKALNYYKNKKMLFEELYKADISNIDFKEGLASSFQRLGEIEKHMGNHKKALGYFKDYSQLILKMYEADPKNSSIKNILAISYDKLGSTYSRLDSIQNALTYYNKAFKLAKELYDKHPLIADFKEGLIFSYEKLGMTHNFLGNFKSALTNSEKALNLASELYKTYPRNINFKNRLTISFENFADINVKLSNNDIALLNYEKALKLAKELYLTDPENLSLKEGVAVIYTKLGIFFNEQLKEKNRAIFNFKEAEKVWIQLVRDAPKYKLFSNQLTIVKNTLSELKE